MKWVNSFLVIFSAFLLVSCATMEDRWRGTQHVNTVASYEIFVKSYPDSPYIASAKKRIADLKEKKAFEDAEAKNTVVAYRAFLQEYPAGTFAEEAKKRIAAPDWEAFSMTCQLATMQGFLKAGRP